MDDFRQRLSAHLRFRAAAYLVLLVALVPTLLVYWRVVRNVHSRDEARFTTLAHNIREATDDSFKQLIADLRAFSGLIEANPAVTRHDWNTFLETLGYGRRHPGVRSIGYSERVPAEKLGQFTSTMRLRVGSSFDVFPTPTNRISFPTVHVRQFPTNVAARLGWDAYSDPPRREALDTVLETGLPSVTRKATYWIANEPEADGFTIFLPVRASNGVTRGVVFSSFIPQYLFNSLSNRQIDATVSVEMFDGVGDKPGPLLASLGVSSPPKPAAFQETIALRLLGHTFYLRVRALPAFEALSESALPKFVLAGGLAFTFLLFGITWFQASARSATERINRRLRESEEQLRAVNAELEQRIADSKLTEGLLAHERDVLRTLLDNAPDAVYFKDRDSRFIKCGRAVHEHLGLKSVTEVLGKRDFDFFTDEHAHAAYDLEQKIMQTGEPVVGLVEKETWHDGRVTWVLSSKMPLRDKKGTVIGTFGISKDITRLKDTELALEKEKEMLAVTLRSIGDGVITTDVRGRILLCNQVAERLTGWTQGEAAGRRLKEVFRTSDVSSGESNTELLHRVLDDSKRQGDREALLVARDGSERNISQTWAPIINRAGQNIGAVLVFRDITEKVQTEAELLKASKLESIGLLAGGIAHDFNNVLTVILGNISLARIAEAMGQPVAESLVEAENASVRARELTQRLLTFAKGGAPIRKPLDLYPLARECAARVLQDSDVITEFFADDDLWMVDADDAQIIQVLQNLITHARAAMSKDPRLDIHVLNREVAHDPFLLLKAGRYVRVSIRDYGAGIEPGNLTKIFEPYFGPGKQGSGLELATAYSIVRKHEGQIRVESIPGQGTVFHVYLPVAALPAAEDRPARTRRLPLKIPQRVLVMDDELPIRKLAALLLEGIGCRATTAADGAEAIQLYESARLRGEPFGAVIMDLTVPHGLGGKETIRQLKEIDPNVLAIVSSGYSNDPVMANYRDFGFAGVVPKPYNSDDLATALEELFPESNEIITLA